MSARKWLGYILMASGAVLLLAALLLFLYNGMEDSRAEKAQAAAMDVIHEAITTLPPPPEDPAPTCIPETVSVTQATEATHPIVETTAPKELRTEVINGHEYLGYLYFPTLDRELPLMKLVYIEDLQLAPCLQSGSPVTDNAVISGHNYPAQLGPLRDFIGGEEVVFTDLDGEKIYYTVAEVTTLDPKETDAILNSSYHMVIYTCTPGGSGRVLLGLNRSNP